MYGDEKSRLEKAIAEYERLRKLLRMLDDKAGEVDHRLVEIERELPDAYECTDDPPHNLYILEKLAAANHRDIEHEIISCIEQGVRGRRIDPELVLERARKLREEIGGLPITDDELTKAKKAGRP